MSISYHVKQKKPPKFQSTLSSAINIPKTIYMVIRNNREGEKNVLSGRCAYSTSLYYKEGDTITHRPQVHQI